MPMVLSIFICPSSLHHSSQWRDSCLLVLVSSHSAGIFPLLASTSHCLLRSRVLISMLQSFVQNFGGGSSSQQSFCVVILHYCTQLYSPPVSLAQAVFQVSPTPSSKCLQTSPFTPVQDGSISPTLTAIDTSYVICGTTASRSSD